MKFHGTALLVATVIVVGQQSSFGVVSSLTTNASNELLTMTVDGHTHAVGDLIGIDLVAFDGDSAAVLLTQSNNALPQVPAPGSRATLLEDARLDTGVINPDQGNMTVTINFLSAVVNRAGADIIVLEFDTISENGNDPLQVFINGITKVYALSEGTNLKTLTSDVFSSTSGQVNSLAQLESDTFTRTSDNTTQGIYAYSIDLSDFGIANGASIASMQFGSSGGQVIDPVFIAGLVPEPATVSLLALAGAALLRRRRAA